MADWAPDYTPRAILKYRSAGLAHSWTFRYARGTTAAVVQTSAEAAAIELVTALESVLPTDFAVTEAFYIAEDSNISVPFSAPVVVPDGAVDYTTMSTEDKARAICFAGKSTAGLPGRLYVFGIAINPDTTSPGGLSYGLMTSAEYPFVASAVASLNLSGLRGNDGAVMRWYQRVTHKVNDYWWKVARRSGGFS